MTRLAPFELHRPGSVPEATALLRAPDGTWSVSGVGEVAVYVEGRPASLADLP
jgi:hypothetical protein